MWKGGTKVRSVDIRLSGTLGEEQTVTPGAEDVHGIIPRKVAKSHRQHRLTLTENVRTPSKACRTILLVHGMHTPIGNNVPCMDQPIQHFGGTLDNLLLFLR